MKTTIAIAKGIALGAALIAIASLMSCAIPPDSQFNPLDQPGHQQPTVEELHAENITAITDSWHNRF